MSQATDSVGFGVSHSEKMFCIDCFRTKGDGDVSIRCQNPKCHLYLGTPTSSRDDDVFNTRTSGLFSREVGHDRKMKSLPQEHVGSQIGSGLMSTNRMWGYQASNSSHVSMHQVTEQKPRSKSVSASPGDSRNLRKLLSSFQGQGSLVEGKVKQHPRFLSLSSTTGSFLKCNGEGELVEDLFLTGPFTNYGEDDKVSNIYTIIIIMYVRISKADV